MMDDIAIQNFDDVIGVVTTGQVQMPNVAPEDYVIEDYTKRPRRVLRRIKLSTEAPTDYVTK